MTAELPNAARVPVTADDFRELERSRLRALVERSMELAWQLHAPDFQLITPSGRPYTRDRYLGEIAIGAQVQHPVSHPIT